MEGKKKNLGIDIGGTKVNLGVVDECGNVLFSTRMQTDAKKEPELLIAEIAEKAKNLLEQNSMKLADVEFIGAGVPGTADVHTGLVSYCPNLSWYDVPAGAYFRKYLGREVRVAQDSRNAALAELLFGAGRGYSDILCLTVGTGIGAGIIINKKIFNGGMNTAGELGHTPIVKDGAECICGNSGCLERYASGNGMTRLALERFPDKFEGMEKKCESISELAYAGDQEICAFLDECIDNLAFGIANAVNLLSPEAVIISGGLCEHEKLSIEPLKKKIIERGYYSWTRLNRLWICKAALGSDAPMIGAAMLYQGI